MVYNCIAPILCPLVIRVGIFFVEMEEKKYNGEKVYTDAEATRKNF
jgi:hypothetical protein